MSREQQIVNWGEAKTVDGRSAGLAKAVLNLLRVAALVTVLGPGRQLFYTDLRAADQARAVERLVQAFDEHLAGLGVVLGETSAGAEQLDLVGPPNGTLFEPAEEITLRWSHNVPLQKGQSYRVAVAYYSDVSVPLEPAFRYFTTTEETLQLSALNVNKRLPIMMWTVYVARDGSNTATGVKSGTHRMLQIVRPELGNVYSWDSGL